MLQSGPFVTYLNRYLINIPCRGAATTAGWRKAPALTQRVCTRGLASPSSISLKNTMNTAGLEWFGPPERNTLRPLCDVLPSERETVGACVS